jgi:hypothetical protein
MDSSQGKSNVDTVLGPNLRQEVDNILTELSMIINKKKKTE